MVYTADVWSTLPIIHHKDKYTELALESITENPSKVNCNILPFINNAYTYSSNLYCFGDRLYITMSNSETNTNINAVQHEKLSVYTTNGIPK